MASGYGPCFYIQDLFPESHLAWKRFEDQRSQGWALVPQSGSNRALEIDPARSE